MMKRVAKPDKETPSPSFGPQQQNRFAPRPFPVRQPEPEAPAECCEPLFSYSLKDVSPYPREPVQPKLRLGPVGDRYEQEADRVARRVVETISSPEQDSVQRVEDEDEDELDLEELEEEAEVQRQTAGAISSSDQDSVQRKDGEDEDEPDLEELEEDEELRRTAAGIAPAGAPDVGPDLESAIHRARGRGQPLSDGVRQPMERAFGADFGGVRVHADSKADSLNRSLQARAFTTGQDIFLRQGVYRPGSSEGQRLLAHELTHVVQQSGGAVQRAQMQATGRILQAKEEASPNRTGMPDHLKSGLESLSGMDLSGVRVHYNSPKPAHLNALAYTQGREIHVAPGQERHLPHEGWHAVQQKQGRVRPSIQIKTGVLINDDVALETEADVMGAKASHLFKNITHQGHFIDSSQKDHVLLNRPVIQDKIIQLSSPLTSSKLNVVGENHLLTENQMESEKKYSEKFSGSPNYWREDEFKTQKGDRGPIADPFKDRFEDALHIVIAHRTNFKTITEEWKKVPWEKKSESKKSHLRRLRGYIRGRLIKTLPESGFDYPKNMIDRLKNDKDGFELDKNEKNNFLKLESFTNCLSEDASTVETSLKKPGEMDEAVEALYKMTNSIDELELKYNQLVAQIRKIDVISASRATAMHNAAEKRSDQKGVWKIGESHRLDIYKSFKKRSYNLVSQDKFNNDLNDWLKRNSTCLVL